MSVFVSKVPGQSLIYVICICICSSDPKATTAPRFTHVVYGEHELRGLRYSSRDARIRGGGDARVERLLEKLPCLYPTLT